jgi:HSP20 family protein
MSLSLFNDPFEWGLSTPFRTSNARDFTSLGSCDIVETEDAHIFKLDAPGMSESDVQIDVHDNVLSISGERKSEFEETDETTKVHRVERSYGSFKRSFRLPDGVDAATVSAEFEGGVLSITVPKPTEPRPAKHSVPITYKK